jgi:hypothetical protein
MAKLCGLSDGGRYGAEAGARCTSSRSGRRMTLSCSFGSVRERTANASETGVIGQMRDAGRDVAIVVSLHGQIVLQLLAVPHPGLTIED